MHRFTPSKPISALRSNGAATLTVLAGLLMLAYGCSSSKQPVSAGLFSPPLSLSGTATAGTARSLSSMEAISRGVAAVTPPGAALKDVYYQFDSVDLEGQAQGAHRSRRPLRRCRLGGVQSRPRRQARANGKRLSRQPRHRHRTFG